MIFWHYFQIHLPHCFFSYGNWNYYLMVNSYCFDHHSSEMEEISLEGTSMSRKGVLVERSNLTHSLQKRRKNKQALWGMSSKLWDWGPEAKHRSPVEINDGARTSQRGAFMKGQCKKWHTYVIIFNNFFAGRRWLFSCKNTKFSINHGWNLPGGAGWAAPLKFG